MIKTELVEGQRQSIGTCGCAGSRQEVESAARTDEFVTYTRPSCLGFRFFFIVWVSTFITRLEVVNRKKL